MAITRQTLQLLRRLRVDVGETADAATRDLTKAWVSAWDELHTQASAAVDELVAAAASAGRWPQPWELARMRRLQETLAAAEQALAQLGTRTGVTVTDAAGQVIGATVDHEPRLIASQLPAAEQVTAAQRFAARIVPQVAQVMVARTQAHIVNTARPLSADAMDAMRRELVAGVAVGDNPRTSARNMVDRVEGAFNGGLTRAMTIARTEILDAYRAASAYAHVANADVLSGWTWICACDRRSCFPAGTNITTRLGDVAIEDVREGDEVLTHAGRWRRAYEPMAQPYLGPMVIVEAGPLRVTATADHPFLIERQGKLNWVEAQYVRCGDRVLSHLQRVSNGIDHQFGEISVPLHRYIVSRVDSHIQATIVYNFEVEGDHSYIANGIAVHNCPSCWSKHGSVYPVTTPGPWDHAQGRCARMPTVRPWSDLGINIPEPASTLPDAQARFWSLPATDRMAVMGPARLELLRTGAVGWSDLAARRTAAGWRDSFGPRSVRDLERIAGSRRAAGIAPQPHPLAPAMAPAPKARPAPAPKVKAAAPTFPTDPKVGDLFMGGYTERKAVAAARRVAVEGQFNGEYAGLTVRVTEVQATDSAVAVDGKILHPDGRQVGLFTRAFYREGDEIIAYHSLLDLDRAVQGQGFAEAFNRHLTDWYRRSGVDRIMLHANIDVGGYAWARNGYDFAKAKDADKVLARLRGKVDAYRARTAGLVGDELAAMQRQIVAAEKILADGDRYEFGQVEYPSAYRISQVGRWDGAARDDMWIGKDAMLKSSWHGVKPL